MEFLRAALNEKALTLQQAELVVQVIGRCVSCGGGGGVVVIGGGAVVNAALILAPSNLRNAGV